MSAKKINVKGRVQGVFFRASTVDQALQLGLKGWVKNEPDGSVTIVAEGDNGQLEKLIQWCHQGPTFARVEKVAVEDSAESGLKGFEIKR